MLNDKNQILIFEDVKVSLDGRSFIRVYDKSIKNYDDYPRKYTNANIYETSNYIIVKVKDNCEEKFDYSFENKDEAIKCFQADFIQDNSTNIFNTNQKYCVKGTLKRVFDKTFYFPKQQTYIQYIDNQTSEEFISK